MVYNWDGKEVECYRLYVEERRSLDEVIEYWEQRGFTPSKRAFQTQFRRWEFPSKQNPAHKNAALVARVEQLWENNVAQKDMLRALHAEGFHISDRELMRLRLRFKWLLRESRTKDASSSLDTQPRAQQQQHEAHQSMLPPTNHSAQPTANLDLDTAINRAGEPSHLEPAELHRRHAHRESLLRTSAERYQTRQRRRRTRPWAGLPADAPGLPPRFPSETTLDEAKAILSLSSTEYRNLRHSFQTLCEAECVLKKKEAGPQKWSSLKRRLVAENASLKTVFEGDAEAMGELSGTALPTPREQKGLALDVICTDVIKRLRMAGTRVGIPDAKNILGLNPAEAREVRSALHGLLKADQFPSKHEAGEEHWAEVKSAWIQGSELLRRVFAGADADAKFAEKKKAVDIIARDVVKRFRAEQHAAKHPPKPNPNPNPVKPQSRKPSGNAPGTGSNADSQAIPTLSGPSNRGRDSRKKHTHAYAPSIPANAHIHCVSASNIDTLSNFAALASAGDLQIDPSLLLAASDPSLLLEPIQNALPSLSAAQPQPHPQHQPFLHLPPATHQFSHHPSPSTSPGHHQPTP